MQGIHRWTTLIRGREVEESRPVAGIVPFVKTLERTSFRHMPMYVIEFVIKIIVICFENNIKCDAPNPGGLWTTRQPAEDSWMLGN